MRVPPRQRAFSLFQVRRCIFSQRFRRKGFVERKVRLEGFEHDCARRALRRENVLQGHFDFRIARQLVGQRHTIFSDAFMKNNEVADRLDDFRAAITRDFNLSAQARMRIAVILEIKNDRFFAFW